MEIEDLYNLYKEHFLVDTDTRKIRKNSIYFSLKGENFNGNKFAEEALEKGAIYAIVDEEEYRTKENILLVDDVLKTLQDLANYHRKKINTTIVSLTGSNGKTTTKELIFSVLKTSYRTIATKGNLNNHIGVPLTLLTITPDIDIAIIEMGANHQKEIAFLCEIAEPDYGYITNFGKAHLEGFGGVEGVIKGKSEMYDFLRREKKKAFVNPNDKIQIEKTKDISSITLNFKDIILFKSQPFLTINYKDVRVNTNLVGSYNFNNIAAAITIGNYFNVSKDKIKNALETYIPKNNRSQIIKTKLNTIILDAYNANPSSMKVALDNLSELTAENKVAILGDMFELGNESEKEHNEILKHAKSLNINLILSVGKNFYKSKNSHNFKGFENLVKHLQQNPINNSTILIKGSRGMKLERLLNIIN